jgi:malonate transporter and related proteins
MLPVLEALVPVFLIIALGVVLKRTLLPHASAWEAFERIVYFVLFPALLFLTTATADLRDVPVSAVGGALFLSVIAMAAFTLALRPLLPVSGPAFTSIFQGATRWNTYVALAIAGGLFGVNGITLTSVAIVAMVPLLNFLCVLVLAWFASETSPDARKVLDQLVRNPLIWSVLAGMAVNLGGLPLPKIAVSFLDILGRGSLTLGLLVVGGGLELNKLIKPNVAVVVSTFLKLAIMPLMAVSLGYLLGLSGMALTVVAIASSVPTAPGSYILARQIGGDAPLMARIITTETVIAALTIPIALAASGMLAP